MPSSTAEDYLKIILQKSVDEQTLVPMGEIATGMGVVPGTATTMIKSLAERGFLEHVPRQGVRLTETGRRAALNVLRKHRLVESFLVTVLKMDWAEVHEEAERLEHALSDRVLTRIDALLGHPKFDPHGDPIPCAEGSLDDRVYQSLATCPQNKVLRLVRIADQSTAFLQFAERAGLVPGESICVTEAEPTAGTITVRFKAGQTVTLGLEQARNVLVGPLS